MSFAELEIIWIVVNIVVLLFSLSIHESAHAWTADRLGDGTARHLGRVTLNPVPHISPVGTILFPLIGLVSGAFLFGWAKPVPVNTANLKNPKKDHLLVAAAGPASNIAAGLFFLICLKILGFVAPLSLSGQSSIVYPLYLICDAGIVVNVILAVFNLLPIPPLDGSWILSGLLPDKLSQLFDWIRPYGFLLLILLLYAGFFGRVLGPVLAFVRQIAL